MANIDTDTSSDSSMAEPEFVRTTFDEAGDLMLKLDAQAPYRIAPLPKRIDYFRVSSAIMCFMSPAFKAMLNGPFAEGQPVNGPGPRELHLPEDDAQGMMCLCHALHNEPGMPAISSREPIERSESLLEMLLLADKYMTMRRVAKQALAWLNDAVEAWKKAAQAIPDDTSAAVDEGLVLLTALCYFGRHTDGDQSTAPRLFQRVAQELILLLEIDDKQIEKFARPPYSDILPATVLVHILKKHAAVMVRTVQSAGALFHQYRCKREWSKASCFSFPINFEKPRSRNTSSSRCLETLLGQVERSRTLLVFKSRIDLLAKSLDSPESYRAIERREVKFLHGFKHLLHEERTLIFIPSIRWCCLVQHSDGKEHECEDTA